jgi:hypothetical protein
MIAPGGLRGKSLRQGFFRRRNRGIPQRFQRSRIRQPNHNTA